MLLNYLNVLALIFGMTFFLPYSFATGQKDSNPKAFPEITEYLPTVTELINKHQHVNPEKAALYSKKTNGQEIYWQAKKQILTQLTKILAQFKNCPITPNQNLDDIKLHIRLFQEHLSILANWRQELAKNQATNEQEKFGALRWPTQSNPYPNQNDALLDKYLYSQVNQFDQLAPLAQFRFKQLFQSYDLNRLLGTPAGLIDQHYPIIKNTFSNWLMAYQQSPTPLNRVNHLPLSTKMRIKPHQNRDIDLGSYFLIFDQSNKLESVALNHMGIPTNQEDLDLIWAFITDLYIKILNFQFEATSASEPNTDPLVENLAKYYRFFLFMAPFWRGSSVCATISVQALAQFHGFQIELPADLDSVALLCPTTAIFVQHFKDLWHLTAQPME